jgi:hypothetical protein
MEFTTTREGWVQVEVSQDYVDLAHEMYDERVEIHKNISGLEVGDNIWVGDLGEIVLDEWLTHHGLAHHWGQPDEQLTEPDFRIGDAIIDAKTSLRNNRPHRHWTVGFPEHQLRKPIGGYFFMVYRPPQWKGEPHLVWLLGAIPRKEFEQECTHDKKGDMLSSGFPCRASMYNVTIDKLISSGDCLEDTT